MSRARGNRQDEKNAFLQANPEIFEHDTELSVGKSGGIFEVQAEGEKGLLRDYEEKIIDTDPEITLLRDLDTFEVDFDFFDNDGEDDALMTLTEEGFGLIGEDDDSFDGNGDLTQDAMDIREGEVLDGDVRFEDNLEDDEGLIGVNIEFKVLNDDAGTVELNIEDDGPDQLITFDVSQDSAGTMGNIAFVAPSGDPFTDFQFTVSGDVQVSVIGIGFSTNFVEVFDL